MKREFMSFFCILLVLIVSAPYIIKDFDVSAYSEHLMSFDGEKISGGIAAKGSFVPKNDYIVVNANLSKWNAPSNWTQPPRYNGLDVKLRIKGLIGYSVVSTKTWHEGTDTKEYITHKGKRYDLYFKSYNYNYWNCKGAVYAKR